MEAVSQSLERGTGGLGRGLRVDLHGHCDLRMAQDLHDLGGMDIEIDQESCAGTSTIVNGDLADSGFAAAGVPGSVEVARLDWGAHLVLNTHPPPCHIAPATSRAEAC